MSNPKPTYPSLPRIRRDHILSQGLIHAWIMSDNYDVNTNNGVDQTHNGAFQGGPNPSWVNTPYGIGISFTASSNQYIKCGSFVGPQAGYTCIVISKIASFPHNVVLASLFNFNAASYSQFTVLSTGQYECRILKWVSGSTYNWVGRHSNTGIYTTGSWHHSAYTWSGGTTNSAIKIFQDGAQVDTSDNGNGTFTGPDTNSIAFNIAAQFSSGSYDTSAGFNGQMAGVWVYNRALSQAEIALHQFDPFAMFRRPSWRIKSSSVHFRRTASPVGSRVGSRQRMAG